MYFKTSKVFLNNVTEKDYKGLIVSSDTFVSTKKQKEHILANFPKALACDMEGASICQVAEYFRRKFMVIRTISDIVGSENHVESYHDYKKEAVEKVVKDTLNSIKNL